MAKLISVEGCIGAGKTSLTNYFSHELGMAKVLEEYEKNPFLHEFYEGLDIKLETEATFLLIHYSQLKKAIASCKDAFILADFSIEKDWVYARLNLSDEELEVFENIYNHVTQHVGIPHVVIYVDVSLEVLRRRILQRGRSYEMNANITYFEQYNDKARQYFKNESKSRAYFFHVDDLELDPGNEKLGQIRNAVLEVIKKAQILD